MTPRNENEPHASRRGTRLDALDGSYRRLAGLSGPDDSSRARRAQPRRTHPDKLRRLNDDVARSAYAEAKRLALQALTAKAEWEREELRERSRAAWALFKSAALEAAQ